VNRTLAFILVLTCGTIALLGQTGTVTGKVLVDSPRNTVVYLEPVAAHVYPAPARLYTMDQMNMTFQPHVLVLPVGATVEFLNTDTPMHNVMWPSVGGDKKLAKNLGSFGKGEKRTFRFDKVGVVPILCNVHPEMSAFVVVTPTPYFALIDNHIGDYRIENVPDGDYIVHVWHEGMKQQTKPLKVTTTNTADFDLTK
jgi:plastocyanin